MRDRTPDGVGSEAGEAATPAFAADDGPVTPTVFGRFLETTSFSKEKKKWGFANFLRQRYKREGKHSNNVDPLVNVFGQIYLTVKYI
jgi:hypothetical protein